MDDRGLERSNLELLVVGHVPVRLERRDAERETKKSRLKVWLPGFGFIQLVEQDLGAGEPLFNDRMIGEVVEMAVRQPQPDHVPAAFGGFVEERPGCVVRRIEKDGLFGGFIGDEKAIGHRYSAGVREHDHR